MPALGKVWPVALASETHDGPMAAQVATWNPADLRWKVPPTSHQ
jgi:hypothetical protein